MEHYKLFLFLQSLRLQGFVGVCGRRFDLWELAAEVLAQIDGVAVFFLEFLAVFAHQFEALICVDEALAADLARSNPVLILFLRECHAHVVAVGLDARPGLIKDSAGIGKRLVAPVLVVREEVLDEGRVLVRVVEDQDRVDEGRQEVQDLEDEQGLDQADHLLVIEVRTNNHEEVL